MGLPEKKLISLEAYLALEASTAKKHQYYKGAIFAMDGATVELTGYRVTH